LEAPDVNLAGKLGWVTAVYDHTYVVKFAIPERMIVSSICVERHEIDWIQNFHHWSSKPSSFNDAWRKMEPFLYGSSKPSSFNGVWRKMTPFLYAEASERITKEG